MTVRPSGVSVPARDRRSDEGVQGTSAILLHQVIEQRYELRGRRALQSVLDLDPQLLPRLRVRRVRPHPAPTVHVWEEPDRREDLARRLRVAALWMAGVSGAAAAIAGAVAIGF